MHPKFNITQQFLAFFILTSVLPIAVICIMLFQSIDNKFTDRISRMLDIGGLFAEEVYHNNLEKLSLSISQSASFSLRREYFQFLRSKSSLSLRTALDQYREVRGLDFIVLYNPTGQVVAHVGWQEDLSTPSVQEMWKAGLQGKTVQSIEHFPSHRNRFSLEYLASAPIISNEGKVLGVLLAGQSLVKHFSFPDLITAFPGLDMRIYMPDKNQQNYRLLFSSIKESPESISRHEMQKLAKYSPQKYVADDIISEAYQEEFNEETYKSKALTLRNYLNQPVGFLVVSTSENDLKELKSRNLNYIGLYLMFGFLLVIVSGIWFKRTFINPFSALSRASEKVANGNLNAEIQERTSQYEIAGTIHSFNRMVQQLRETEKLRNTFVSTLTHDLRTPLIAQKRVLKMYDEFNHELPQEMAVMNAQLLKNNEHLLDMVNRILESYQYEAGKIVLHPEPFSLSKLVEECFSAVSPLAQSKDLRLMNQVPADMSDLYADKHQLKRVLQNLIGNALENTQKDHQVIVRARPWDSYMTIEVEDNGIGISSELLPHLFTRYFTGNRLRQKIGSGLGLYICRMIVELHGGSIEARSDLGEGTLIRIRIPQKAAVKRETVHAS
jgi:two-component system, sensor histidine kinase and response regulator